MRDWRDGRDGGGFEVRSLRFSELRTPNFELRIAPFSPVSLDVPVARLRGWRPFSASCYRMLGSKLTLAFMELEIRQFASAFSISSLALAASVLVASVMVGFNVMAVN